MKIKKLLCIIFAIILSASIIPYSFAADIPEYDTDCKTECKGECDYSPLIIVPGIMQSQTYVQGKDGKDIMTSDGFPIVEGMDLAFMFDTEAVKQEIKAKLPAILKAMAKRDRQELLDVIIEIFGKSFADHYFNPDGTRVNKDATDKYWYSLEECKNVPDKSYGYAKGYSKDENGNVKPTTKYETQYDFIQKQVDITAYCEKAGYDHTYYYSYSSFGNILEDAENLNEYIDMVKAQTGHSKVSLVFISLGGTIANTYLADYIDKSEIDRIILAAAALDGSYLLGDLMAGKTTFNNGYALYNDLVPGIVSIAAEEYMALGYAGNAIARAIPQELFSDFLQEALERALDDVLGKCIRNCQSMWALVPSEMYPEMAKKYISDDEHKALKEMTDRYYNIQKNSKNRIKELEAEGVDIFVITGYNLQLPPAVEHYKQSSDEIIQSTSTSAGATFAPLGSSFPESYKPAIDSTYIDPDGIVDAGTCALPDKTFFVKNQSHLKLQSSVNDVIGLCVAIITDKSIKDARENSGGYRQFNEYRDLSTIESLMRQYNEADKSKVKASKLEKCESAYKKAEALKASKEWSQAETLQVEKEFYKAMESAKLINSNADSSFLKYTLMPMLTKIFKAISDLFAKVLKGNDYWLFFIPII